MYDIRLKLLKTYENSGLNTKVEPKNFKALH